MDDNYIEFEHVSKSFWLPDGQLQQVLDDVSFFVPRGETVAILGRSGVGKSVTLKNIVGFLKPDSGSIRVDGREITGLAEEELAELRRRMSMVFQSGALFDSLTVAENVAFPIRERALLDGREVDEDEVARRVSELLATVELSDDANAMPADLSTGMKRAVAIARALASEPDCILYDEPTTLVDPLMAQTITRLILRLKERYKKTSVVVTHDVRLAERVADRLVMLEEGRVSFFGTPEEWAACTEPEVERFRSLDALPGIVST
jgi:phospholipid/cholesterol/gamma-HCH transport system ATP-binding protein